MFNHKTLAVAAAIAGAVIVGGTVAVAAGGSPAASYHGVTHRPVAAHATNGAATTDPVTAFTQEFQSGTGGFCPSSSGNLPCNGGVGNYGPINRAITNFSNGGVGNYAPFAKALVGKFYAWTSGSQAMNQPAQGGGCPSTSVEYCTGPYALFGDGLENVFPSGGFTVTNDLYLSPNTAKAGNLADDDVELNTSTGAYGVDNVITTCEISGGIAISFGQGSPGACGTTPQITKAGWYRFIFEFNASGTGENDVVLTEKVEAENSSDTVLADSGQQDPTIGGAPIPVASAGGPGYFWLPTENVVGLPLANFALQLGQQGNGNTP